MKDILVIEGEKHDRERLREALFGLDALPGEIADKVITAWMTAIKNSRFEHIEEVPYSLLAPKHRLIDHVNDVVKLGLLLARGARDLWNFKIDDNKLIQVLLLHDVDKPLLYSGKGNMIQKSDLSYRVPHGVLGGLILNKVGFPDDIVYIVSTHSIESPFHGTESEAYILHYADLFSADHILIEAGAQPFYEKHVLP